MPTKDDHFNKYKNNKKLLKSDIFDIESCKYLDWVVTIVFYGALHLVEKRLDELKSIHSKDHRERKTNILTTRELLPISAQYHTLYIQSMRARYDNCSFTKDDVKRAFDLFKDIERIAS